MKYLLLFLFFIGCNNFDNSVELKIYNIENCYEKKEKDISFKILTFFEDSTDIVKLKYKLKFNSYYFNHICYDNLYYKNGTILQYSLTYIPLYIISQDSLKSYNIKWGSNKNNINIFGIRNFFDPDENSVKDNDTIKIWANYKNFSDTIKLLIIKE